ncbi:MAG TPA: methylmalonyl-CoA decarboxylase [Ktedonobacteraceae bacterium]|nr:methylmalonyl-CoA decarboxylase [Ktedonobacteraceae bacterium]
MFILADYVNSIGTLTLNQPAKRNALSEALVEELLTALADFQRAGTRVVVLRAAPDASVWSSGHDISELPQGRDPLPYSDPFERALRAVKTFPAPVIAMVHGSVWGVATDLVLSCDIAIGDETSSFAVTPANIGLAYNTAGLLRFMRRLPLNRVKEMFFTGEPVTASDAVEWGILNHLVAASELEARTYDLARRMASKAPLVLSVVKEQLRILADASPISSDVFERIEALREAVYQSEDYLEGIRAFREKRPPHFSGR